VTQNARCNNKDVIAFYVLFETPGVNRLLRPGDGGNAVGRNFGDYLPVNKTGYRREYKFHYLVIVYLVVCFVYFCKLGILLLIL